jgi:hypothetical protein
MEAFASGGQQSLPGVAIQTAVAIKINWMTSLTRGTVAMRPIKLASLWTPILTSGDSLLRSYWQDGYEVAKREAHPPAPQRRWKGAPARRR